MFFVAAGVTTQAAYYHYNDDDSPKLTQAYPQLAGTKLDSCTTCHAGGTYQGKTVGSCQWCHITYGYDGSGDINETLNSYGKDYMAHGESINALTAIEPLDSDKDGYTNIQEIDAITFPGDPNDNPGKVPAPRYTYTLSELEALARYKEFLLMNTARSGDYCAEYEGPTMLDLLNDAGMVSKEGSGSCSTWNDVMAAYQTYVSGQSTWNDVISCYTGYTMPDPTVTAFAPDGFSWTYLMDPIPGSTLYYINGTYPQSQYYYDPQADKALNPVSGWCDYSAPSCRGRNNGDIITVQGGLKHIFAFKRDGEYLVPGQLDDQNRLDINTEGPFRAVPPQMVPGPPDQSATSAYQDVVWPYNTACGQTCDHNAGSSVRCVVAIRVEPLPAGTTDFNWYEGGWDYIDSKQFVVYGNILNGNASGTVTKKGTTQPIDKVKIASDRGGYITLTNSTGSFSLVGLKLGTYTLTASATGYKSASQTVIIKEGVTATVNLALESD
jgi:hypothetical protein